MVRKCLYFNQPGGEENKESGVISYGGLYTLLIRLDFDVKGTAEHFTVTGADGHSYEFSYSFWEEKELDWITLLFCY